jgi:hypothetical protein
MKTTIISVLLIIFILSIVEAKEVEIVVAGVISHGPMQPTVQIIEEVASKYGLEVKWIDMDTPEGKLFFEENKLDAHLNILINGKYSYLIDEKQVNFQWFEGVDWTREDLEKVISGTLNDDPNIINQNIVSSNSGFPIRYFIIPIAGMVALIAFIIIRRRKK